MKTRAIAGWLTILQVAFSASAWARTPCDILGEELRTLAREHPEATEDRGDGHFLSDVIGPKTVRPVLGVDCNSFKEWARKEGIDTSAANLDEDKDDFCWRQLYLYDERGEGGFIVLAGEDGSAHCPVVQVFDLDKNKLQGGWSWDSDCSPASFEVLRVGGRAYPTMLRPKLYDKDLSYHLELISVGGFADSPSCALSIIYQPEFVARWFGPKGEDDVSPELRRAVGPIVSSLANDRDAASSIQPWLDRPSGNSPYDFAISGYPDRPIDGLRYPNTGSHVYDLPWAAPFLSGPFEAYNGGNGILSGEAAIPLAIDGRRLLLVFGFATTYGLRSLPDPAFGIWEYNDQKRDFDPVAGGVMQRHGRNPTIE